MTCALCNRFQGKWSIADMTKPSTFRGKNRHHIIPKFTWNEMCNSAESCYCCNLLVSGCCGCFHQHNIKESDILYGSLHFYYPTTIADAELQESSKNLVFFMRNGQRFIVELFATEDDDCPVPDSWDYIPVSRRTSPNTNSSMALATIKRWISTCIATHCSPESFCNSPDNPTLPTRVVDVGLDDGVVKLVEPKGARSKYICLSHCWGLEQIITTETSTLEEHKKCIAWERLSKTFQDAILLSRALGIKYIWIDSLCIIQNDPNDWNVESANMAAVYTNGHLTIAATKSANGAGGLFASTPDFEVANKTSDGEAYRLFFRERIDHHIDMEPFVHDESRNTTATYHPLLTRGWVYQERLLSTRILHFGPSEVYFECRSSIECECDMIEFHGSSPETPIPLFKIEHAEAMSDYEQDWAQQEQYKDQVRYQGANLWRTIVGCYTALLLKLSKDRLPAISGIAKDLASRRKSRYLAGLWEESINDDLLWSVELPSRYKKPRPEPRNAPTWSWASVDSQILYWGGVLFTDLDQDGALIERQPYSHLAIVEKCEVTWSAVDEFGANAGGFLMISGLVVKGVLEREVETVQHEGGYVENIVHFASFSNRNSANNKDRLRLRIRTDYLLDHDGPGQNQIKPGTDVLCLRMSVIQEGSTDHLISLILRESPGMNPGSFERIGMVVLKKKPPPIDPVGELFREAELRTVTIV
ncbi:hypothetical protein AJ79_07870 [Helicocarpus griseus UAMH5409]|uniref:Heterokaryon incompatibility domain-containing protein n=1 Tax=Helicocarpus griseus UAMH5409 TaxID=1447875 RepID=A0A2B7WYQ0_9EURO|nr:hypothetical protein AJ79_07870 [Helicocarpus griseus UAMH5409]